jgi:uncharacterized protein (DUF1778 family)
MIKTSTVRSERIELRAKPEVKAVLERAAQLRHTTISAYLLDSGLQKAKDDLRDSETMTLSEQDRDLFFSLLSSPPEPNDALRALFQNDRP